MPRFPTVSIALAAALLGAAPARADDIGFAGFASASKAVVDIVLSTKLFGEHNLLNSSTAQAALPIAIWEIARDSRLSGSSPGADRVATLDSVDDPGRHDVVFAAALPEPSSYAVLAGGLLAIGLVSRWRAATARARAQRSQSGGR
ncbi:MAG TPA: hypothetical protein VNU71_20670 [Burkholderiaceae bacterium]|nr:hypothetical protein [Burkholderiaceae bacterium]